jgi:hypothetical protein
MEHQLDATIKVLLISMINSTCFGQTFAHLQERKTEIYFYNIWYNVLLIWQARVLYKGSFLHTVPVVPSCSAQNPCQPYQQDTLPYVVKIKNKKNPQFCAPEDGQKFARNKVELILEINKTVTVASSWCSILLYNQEC